MVSSEVASVFFYVSWNTYFGTCFDNGFKNSFGLGETLLNNEKYKKFLEGVLQDRIVPQIISPPKI